MAKTGVLVVACLRGGGFCKLHQRDYDEYLGFVNPSNRRFGL